MRGRWLEQDAGWGMRLFTSTYSNAVRQLAAWKGGERNIAYTPPYVCVATEIVVGDFDVLGSYYRQGGVS